MSDRIIVRNPVILNAVIGIFGFDPLSFEENAGWKVFSKDPIKLFFREDSVQALPPIEKGDRLFLVDFGYGVGSEVKSGDVLLPNFFLPYTTPVDSIDPKDHAAFEGIGEDVVFIENYEEQGDYDFDRFAMSVGGGVASLMGQSMPDRTKWPTLSAAYGADAVDECSHALAKLSIGNNEFFSVLPVYDTLAEPFTSPEQAAGNGTMILKFLMESTTEDPLLAVGEEEDIFDIESDHDEQD